MGEVRRWLSEFGGVHFYYNGLRVSPYGGPDDDWLGMNLQRVRSPEERPGTNTSIGRIDVLDQQNHLVEKTDRSGFIEDGPFRELRTFARDSMDWMATRRLREAEQRRSLTRERAPQARWQGQGAPGKHDRGDTEEDARGSGEGVLSPTSHPATAK